MKPVKIELCPTGVMRGDETQHRVVSLTNTVVYQIGELLYPRDIVTLIRKPEWTVVIREEGKP